MTKASLPEYHHLPHPPYGMAMCAAIWVAPAETRKAPCPLFVVVHEKSRA